MLVRRESLLRVKSGRQAGPLGCQLTVLTREQATDAICLFHRDCETAEICIRHQPDLASR